MNSKLKSRNMRVNRAWVMWQRPWYRPWKEYRLARTAFDTAYEMEYHVDK